MKLFNLLFKLWRAWLWFLVLLGLIVFLPVSLIVIRSPKTYFIFHLFCRYWCKLVLLLNGFWSSVKFESPIDSNQAYIICPNHTSKFDIILLFATFPNNFVFVGKKNVSNIRFFDWFYDQTMITFDRESISSAFRAYRKADKLLKEKTSVVIFPEGRVPNPHVRLDTFKLGAFKLAINNKVPIIPLTFVDNKEKYPEDKLKLTLGRLRVIVHKPIFTLSLTMKNCKILRDKVFETINNTLIDYENNRR